MIELDDDLKSLELLAGGLPDANGFTPLTGRSMSRPHNSRTRRLRLIGVPDSMAAIVGYCLKGTREMREIVNSMTIEEQLVAYRAERGGECRKDILLQLAVAIFNGAREALKMKIRLIKSKSGAPLVRRRRRVASAARKELRV